MSAQTCPSCGEQTTVEPIEPTPAGTGWLRCGTCDHLWPETGLTADAFMRIVSNATVPARPTPGRPPAEGPARALRFEVRLPARIRSVGETEWQRGTTLNISESGVFLRVDRAVPGRTAVEVLLDVPAEPGASGGVTHVRCEGQTVRSVPPVRPGGYASVAVAVRAYRLDG